MPSPLRLRAEAPRKGAQEPVVGISDPELIAGYLRDASLREGHAEALFRPQDEAGIADVVARAQREGVPLTVVAGQTSTTGSSVPEGGWVLSTERLTDLLSVDTEARRARCMAGMNLAALVRAVESQGLFYPPDPTSRDDCSIGGTVACNASGARSFRFGATRRWIRGLRIVLPCGDVLSLERGAHRATHAEGLEIEHTASCAFGRDARSEIPIPGFAFGGDVKNATGFFGGEEIDPIDLFIGSEGLLGVVTEVEVELLPRPAGSLSLWIGFDSEAEAVSFVEAVRDRSRSGAGIRADSIEWFDRASLELIAEAAASASASSSAVAAVAAVAAVVVEQLLEPETTANLEALAGDWYAWLQERGHPVDDPIRVRVASTEAEREAFRRARHAVPTGVNERAARNGMPKIATDFAVGDARLRDVMALYGEARDSPTALLEPALRTAGAQHVASVTFGHVGDNHLHMNFLPTTQAERELAERVRDALTRRAIEWGGSPSAEHGIGKLKRDAFLQHVGARAHAEMRATRRAFDPGEILGRGNLFAP